MAKKAKKQSATTDDKPVTRKKTRRYQSRN